MRVTTTVTVALMKGLGLRWFGEGGGGEGDSIREYDERNDTSVNNMRFTVMMMIVMSYCDVLPNGG